jgi:hypothetical protein
MCDYVYNADGTFSKNNDINTIKHTNHNKKCGCNKQHEYFGNVSNATTYSDGKTVSNTDTSTIDMSTTATAISVPNTTSSINVLPNYLNLLSSSLKSIDLAKASQNKKSVLAMIPILSEKLVNNINKLPDTDVYNLVQLIALLCDKINDSNQFAQNKMVEVTTHIQDQQKAMTDLLHNIGLILNKVIV